MKRKVIAVAVIFHLFVMASPVLPFVNRTAFSKFVNLYARITGAGANFGFFSPNVTNQLTVSFEVTYRDHRTEHVEMEKLVTAETSIRVKNMYRFFTKVYSYPRIRRAVAASFVAYLFKKIPTADTITFEADYYRLPGLKQFEREKRVYQDAAYRATFSRS